MGFRAAIGLGLYRDRPDPEALIRDYVIHGGTYLDFAPNYLAGSAHNALRSVVGELRQCAFGTKVGFWGSQEIRRDAILAGKIPEPYASRAYPLSEDFVR